MVKVISFLIRIPLAPSVIVYCYPRNSCRKCIICSRPQHRDSSVSEFGDNRRVIFRCPKYCPTECFNKIVVKSGTGGSCRTVGSGNNDVCRPQSFINICSESRIIAENRLHCPGFHVIVHFHVSHQNCAGVIFFHGSYDTVEVFIYCRGYMQIE